MSGTSFYSQDVRSFLGTSPDELVGILSQQLSADFSQIASLQVGSWREQMILLQSGLRLAVERNDQIARGTIVLEYTIPVIRRRIDALVFLGSKLLVMEYKQGTSTPWQSALRQAQDYAMDLRDFHEFSREIEIIPLALCDEWDIPAEKKAFEGLRASAEAFAQTVLDLSRGGNQHQAIDPVDWLQGRYFPVPKVIDAAVASFNGHSVAELAHAKADPMSLDRTSEVLKRVVETATRCNQKFLCLLTGVPGAGKTLAGLNVVSSVSQTLNLEKEQAIYLSGNLPLVNVLREALYRDHKTRGVRTTKKKLESMIQEMHKFVKDHHDKGHAPAARLLVFDEAQRAWTSKKNKKKFGRDISEPQMVLEMLDRQPGWSVVVALIGGGQEIHDGEAGLVEWGRAVSNFPNWNVVASEAALHGGASVAGPGIADVIASSVPVRTETNLHLDVSVRSLDSETSAAWVNAVLEGNLVSAKNFAHENLPIFVTRDHVFFKSWLKERQVGTRRTGIVASSAAERLRALGYETPTFSFMRGIDYVRWFLEQAGDVRSSNQLEVAMSEFEVQGLELDHVGLVWGWDFLAKEGGPVVRKFSGTSWSAVARSNSVAIRQAINRYRVLMTRYRSSMIILVPHGSTDDATLSPSEMDETFRYLVSCGARALP